MKQNDKDARNKAFEQRLIGMAILINQLCNEGDMSLALTTATTATSTEELMCTLFILVDRADAHGVLQDLVFEAAHHPLRNTIVRAAIMVAADRIESGGDLDRSIADAIRSLADFSDHAPTIVEAYTFLANANTDSETCCDDWKRAVYAAWSIPRVDERARLFALMRIRERLDVAPTFVATMIRDNAMDDPNWVFRT